MSERRSSVGLRASHNTYGNGSNNNKHARARSAERSVLEQDEDDANHDQVSDRDSDDSEEEEYQKQVSRNRLGSDQSQGSDTNGYDMHAELRKSARSRRASIMDEEDQALPTFNRFPFAEMKNSNCWSEPPHNVFMIRGPDYLSDKKKIPCQQFLLPSRGCDLFLSDRPEQIDMSK
ncbi:MAG: hypothetical protein SGARI_004691 [Bacillariaceae sp.]